MPSAIATRIARLEPSASSTFETMHVVPLVGPAEHEPEYRVFDDTTRSSVTITEVSDAGSIPELSIANDLDAHVLIIAGEELVGAKQNRVLNADVLVPPRTKQTIPVTCVEHGRWRFSRPDFVPGKIAHSSLRGKKSRDVAESLACGRGHRADQSDVWRRVEAMSRLTGARTATSALHDVYDQRQSELDAVRERLDLPADALGIAVFEGDRLLGLDVFDRPSTLHHYWKSLVDSYTLDRLAGQSAAGSAAPSNDLGELVSGLSVCTWASHPSPGVGEDLRLEHPCLTGSALVWDGRSTVHLQVFPKE